MRFGSDAGRFSSGSGRGGRGRRWRGEHRRARPRRGQATDGRAARYLPGRDRTGSMPGRTSQSRLLQYVGVAAALVAVVGFVVFGWRFGGESDGATPLVVGAVCAAVALGWTIYRRR